MGFRILPVPISSNTWLSDRQTNATHVRRRQMICNTSKHNTPRTARTWLLCCAWTFVVMPGLIAGGWAFVYWPDGVSELWNRLLSQNEMDGLPQVILYIHVFASIAYVYIAFVFSQYESTWPYRIAVGTIAVMVFGVAAMLALASRYA